MEPQQTGPDRTESLSEGGNSWLFPMFLVILLLALLGYARLLPQQPPNQLVEMGETDWTPSPSPDGETVSLTVDFGNGASKNFSALPWRPEMTVADLLKAAQNFRPGIEFTQVGSGKRGFLSSLDGLSNEGADGKNWLYRVDGRHAHVSFCLEKLKPDMHVLWTFTDELYNAEADSAQTDAGTD